MTSDLATRDGNIRANLDKWDVQHRWPEDGDEWKGQAALCGVSYAEWKASLIAHLIDPYVAPGAHVLEIAPGHGRWTEPLLARAGRVTAVDLSPSCLEFCRTRFDGAALDCVLTDGRSLPADLTNAVDVVWSYDSFVHMAPDVIAAYLGEIFRVLKTGGHAVLHHANVEARETHEQAKAQGWRSAMDADLMRTLAEAAHLTLVSQFQYWDEAKRIGAPRFNDRITVLRKG